MILQLLMLNANGIFGKAANNLHIYLHFNERRSELASISSIFFNVWRKFFTESTEQQKIL